MTGPVSHEGHLQAPYPTDGALRAEPGVEPGELADDAELEAALEAVLLVVDTAAPTDQLAAVLAQPVARVGAALERLAAHYTHGGRGSSCAPPVRAGGSTPATGSRRTSSASSWTASAPG